MNYKEVGFRAFYHHFCVLPINDITKLAIIDFQDFDNANGVLTYGYYDKEKGLTLEVIAATKSTNQEIIYFDTTNEIRSFIRLDAIIEEEFIYIEDKDKTLEKRYAKKLEALHLYDDNEDVEKTRRMVFLDNFRHNTFIDDVLVYLVKDSNKLEKCWVRITGLGEHFFIGTLLNEPYQDFGYHENDEISFYIHEKEDKSLICIADMNTITQEVLEDGALLEKYIQIFNEDKTELNLLNICEILRDSYVWVPCTAVLNEKDQKQIDNIIDNVEGDYEKLKGVEFTINEQIRLIPDILQNDDKYYFPVFSNIENMGEYGNNFSKVQKHILEVISLARNNEKNISGIVINAFSSPFIIYKNLWDIIENMKSKLSQ